MTPFEDTLWAQLSGEHNADRVVFQGPSERRHRRPLAFGVGLIAAAALASAGVVAFTAGTNAPPAYALTQNPNGSITVTINDLETAIPQLNARFAAMGINETVVPVRAGCHTPAAIPLIATGVGVTPKQRRAAR